MLINSENIYVKCVRGGGAVVVVVIVVVIVKETIITVTCKDFTLR